jgi:hypothetical protein
MIVNYIIYLHICSYFKLIHKFKADTIVQFFCIFSSAVKKSNFIDVNNRIYSGHFLITSDRPTCYRTNILQQQKMLEINIMDNTGYIISITILFIISCNMIENIYIILYMALHSNIGYMGIPQHYIIVILNTFRSSYFNNF